MRWLIVTFLLVACDGNDESNGDMSDAPDSGTNTGSSSGAPDSDAPSPALSADCDQTFALERASVGVTTTTITFYAFIEDDDVSRPIRLCGLETFGSFGICPDGATCTTTDTDTNANADCTVGFGSLVGNRIRVACGNRLRQVNDEGTVITDTGSRWMEAEQL